jgi:hypothetical protein
LLREELTKRFNYKKKKTKLKNFIEDSEWDWFMEIVFLN